MKRIIKKSVMCICLLVSTLSIIGCDNKDKLIGRWINTDYNGTAVMEFIDDKTGRLSFNNNASAGFTYTCEDDKLTIKYQLQELSFEIKWTIMDVDENKLSMRNENLMVNNYIKE